MLLYEYQIRDLIERLTAYAVNVREKFDAGAAASDLLRDASALKEIYESLNERLPRTVQNSSNLGRHIAFMIRNLSRDSINSCRGDIDDICNHDIRGIEKSFREWCKEALHYDSELVDGVSDLVLHQQHDSAVRKAFVILKARLVRLFGAPNTLDGAELVNHVFRRSGCHGLSIDDTERQAIRDLLAGLYGIFRNKYAHNDAVPSWAEADAIMSMVNFVLKDLARLKSNTAP